MDISWREVCQWTSAGGRCANGHQMEGGVPMDISWREVCQWTSAGGRCANGHQLEGGVPMQPLNTRLRTTLSFRVYCTDRLTIYIVFHKHWLKWKLHPDI